MFKRIAPFLLSLFMGLGLLGWWVSQWVSPIPVQETAKDNLWRSVTKTGKGWSVSTFSPEDKGFVTYQKGGLLLYGIGSLPSVNHGEVTSISLSEGGQWIIKSLDPEMRLQIKSSVIAGTTKGEGTLFIDTKEKNLVNFDIDMTTTSNEKVLPSFLRTKDKQIFFDISEQKDVISADLWSLYARFFPLDQVRVLGRTNKKDIDALIRALLDREPQSGSGVFQYDLRARTGLGEVSTLVNKIDKGESCGADVGSCFTLLDSTIEKNRDIFPEVFEPIKKAIKAWIQLDANTQQGIPTWKNIFHTYHNNLLTNNPQARAIRDAAILEMVRSGNTASQYEIWQYLTRILADQKLGSVYSLQIMREMIRIGQELMLDKNTSEAIKNTLTNTAVESLRNLRNLLENAYFTKKEYWFVLRTDLVDGQGKAIQTDRLIQDLQGLIEEIDKSALLKGVSMSETSENDLSIIRGQLAWFKCIFVRNTEYVANPRVCRITVSG